jgi:hypothetical protein
MACEKKKLWTFFGQNTKYQNKINSQAEINL